METSIHKEAGDRLNMSGGVRGREPPPRVTLGVWGAGKPTPSHNKTSFGIQSTLFQIHVYVLIYVSMCHTFY